MKRRAPKLRAAPAEVSLIAWALLTDQSVPEELTEQQDLELFLFECFGRGDINVVSPSLEDIWLAHADAIVSQWVEARPGTRPRVWWLWSSPDARSGALISAARVPPPAEQIAYLREHNLLLPGEAERCRSLSWNTVQPERNTSCFT